jgi:hypothetical protein
VRFGRILSGVRSRPAQLMDAIDAMAPSAAMAGSTAAKGSGAIRLSASFGAGLPLSLANECVPLEHLKHEHR